jgi:hypothetical protein
MRHLRHQPLLIWTLVLVALLALLGIGLAGPGDVATPQAAVPLSATGASGAEELLRRLPEVHATIEAGTYAEWIDGYATFAREQAAEHRDDDQAAWNAVLAAVDLAEASDPQDRPALLGALSELNTAVFSLVRSYR